MVDMTYVEYSGRSQIDAPVTRMSEFNSSNLTAVVFNAEKVTLAYEGLCAEAIHAPPQNVAWVRAWASEVNDDIAVVTAQLHGKTVFALPLEVVDSGPMRIARFTGGSHANGNFPPALPDFLKSANAATLRLLMDALRRARPDIDLVCLNRQLERQGGYQNPMLLLGRSPSPNVALAVDLEDGFDALLARASGKRKRKKNRSQIRKFEAAGGYRIIEASTKDEANRLLTAYFDMKAQQFRQMGVRDVFASKEVQAFFRHLSSEFADGQQRQFLLQGLEVGGKLRAVTGSSIGRDRIVCDFAAFADDELAQSSPGEFLFFHNISSACDAGYSLFDFSVGDERYKRLWHPVESQQFDTLVPLTAKGWLLAGGLRLGNRIKRAAKQSAGARSLIKSLRARLTSNR